MKKRPESELNRLRNEMRADFQLTWGRQADFEKQLAGHGQRMDEFSTEMESMSTGLDSVATDLQTLSTKVQSLAKQASRASRIAASASTIAGEAASISLELQGRYRQMGESFDTVLGALENDLNKKADRDELEALDERVQDLEQDEPPAA